jgi:exonuclease SbcC
MSIVIETVTLENIKSYGERTRIDLGDGVTAVLGDNGAGKSTVQEAVGYALFDTHPFRNQDRLVRDGESSGEIAVTFSNRSTGKEYTVRRSAGRSDYEVLDENGDYLGLDGTTEIKAWICEQLGIDDPDDLSDVWERSVGVPQTDFLADFTKTETDRIDTFDPLFDIERYREAYKSLGGLDEEFDDEIRDHREAIIELRAKLEELPEVESAVEEHEQAVAELNEQIRELTDGIEKLEGEKEQLEALEDDLRDAEQELASLEETKIPAQKRSLQSAKEHRDEAKEAKDTLDAVRDAYERHEAAQDRLDDLGERENERDELEDERNDVGGAIDLLKHQVADCKDDLRDAERARERVAELEPKKERYERLEDEIADLKDDGGRLNEVEDEIEATADEIEELNAEAADIETAIEETEAQRDEAERLSELQDERQELVAERKAVTSERDDCREQNEELRAIDLGDESAVSCPTCDQPVTADHRENVIDRNQRRIEQITSEELPAIEADIGDIEQRIASARDAKTAVDRIPQLESDRNDVEDEIEELRSTKRDLEAERDELEERVAELPKKRDELDDLDGVIEEYHAAKATVENADGVAATLRDARDTLGKKLLEYQRLEAEIAEFEGLDEDIEEAERTIAETEDAHRTYVQNETTAQSLPERQEAVEAEGEQLASLRAERKDAEERVDDLRDEFDSERLEEVEQAVDDRKQQRAKHEQQQEDRSDDLEDARDRLEDLEAKRDRLEDLEAEVAELERDREFARWARNSLQQGAEDLRDLTTTEIGNRANAIFQELRANPTETLVWDKTYNLRVRVRGQNKPFDTLSGGEKMAAALSVRLAILEQLASVGMAFLDEPTANLDAGKKQNLVGQLEQLSRLNQLLVISHDRTFESMTERAVELEKDEDREVTRVVGD